MTGWLRRRLMGDGRTDAGASVVTVLLTFLALFALVLTTSEYAANSARPAAADVQWERARSAAQSGLADYVSRLRADPSYWETVDCSNPALVGQPADVVPNSCHWAAGAVGWAPVEPGADVATSPAYHYEVKQGAVESGDRAKEITLAVTGRSAGKYRTLEVKLTRPSSADYVFSSDFWLIDPELWKETHTGALSDECGGSTLELTRYYSQRTAACPNADVYLAGAAEGDVLINDAAWFDGGYVTGQYTTAYEPCRDATSDPASWMKLCLRGSTTYSGQYTFPGGQPQYSTPRTLPDSASTFADVPGCHYYGATRIVLEGSGGMRVWSRDTGAAVAAGKQLAVPTAAGVTPSCGDPAQLASASGQSVPVPNGMAVYVANVPASAGVPNEPIAAKAIGGNSTYGYLPIGGYTGAGPTSASATTTIDPSMTAARKYRPMGNLYLEGTLKGFVTFATEGSIVETGDLVLAGGMSGSDMAGLVAGHSVEIYTPVVRTLQASGAAGGAVWNFGAQTTADTPLGWAGDWSDFTGSKGAFPHRYADADRGDAYPAAGLQIQASVQALAHSMYVQEWWTSALAADASRKLIVQGSVGTRYSGATGMSSGVGYITTRKYDPRLAKQTPPYLTLFKESVWKAGPVGEITTPASVR